MWRNQRKRFFYGSREKKLGTIEEQSHKARFHYLQPSGLSKEIRLGGDVSVVHINKVDIQPEKNSFVEKSVKKKQKNLVEKWTRRGSNPRPSACKADVIPLHHSPKFGGGGKAVSDDFLSEIDDFKALFEGDF